VTASNATGVVVTGSDGSSYTLQTNGGTQTVTPAATTTYTATATGAGGKTTATATVTVTPNLPPTVSITANPTAITAGGSSILTITATNSTSVKVTGTDGSSYTLQPTGGAQPVSPAATTTYTVVATGAGGSVSASATLTVTPNPAPTVTITASPSSITAGSSSTLTVTTVNATQVTLTGSDGTTYKIQSNGGTQTVTPNATTTYTATATGPGGTVSATATVTVTPNPPPTVTIAANPTAVVAGNPSTLTVTATNSTQVTVAGSDGTTYTLQPAGGTQSVTPAATATYTATAHGANGTDVTASTTVTVTPPGSLQSIDHVIFLLQENHSFDNYFGMLNPYRKTNGWNLGDDGKDYEVDGIDDKLTTITNSNKEGTPFSLFKLKSTCVEDQSSDWLASYGDVYPWSFAATRPILMSGFVDDAEGYAQSCAVPGSTCSGTYPDLTGKVAMGYYDQDYFNYYYYMASQFAISDRWFSPVSSKSVTNRIATFTGGTTQGLVKDPGYQDNLPQLDIPNIFQELDTAKVSWKVYYTATQGLCLAGTTCPGGPNASYPATDFSNLAYSYRFMYQNPSGAACTAPTQPSSTVGDTTNSFCIDTTHVAPLSTYYTDLTNDTLPSFAFIEAGYGNNDEHPGSGNSVLLGQSQMAKVINALMASPAWKDSVFFLSYDEGGGPYDHVPPVPHHSNDFTNPSLGATPPDIASIAVNPDNYFPCVPAGGTATLHCDLATTPYAEPGATPGDAAAQDGFAAQLGFRVPNIVISPFVRKHYVSHIPMDHTAVIKFVENRFIGPSAHLTPRDAAQPDLLDFFDFSKIPWASPPSTVPSPVTAQSLGHDPCTPANLGP
jgi:phospholipase C